MTKTYYSKNGHTLHSENNIIPMTLEHQPNTYKIKMPCTLTWVSSPASNYPANINTTLHHISLSTLQSKLEKTPHITWHKHSSLVIVVNVMKHEQEKEKPI